MAAISACSDKESPIEPPIPTSISLSETILEFSALGATRQLTATVKSQSGAELPGVSVSWQSSDPGVIQVSSDGRLTSVSNGTAEIRASAGSVSTAVTARVEQLAALVVVSQGRLEFLTFGDSAQLSASVGDSLGNPMASAAVTWTSSDSGVAEVSPDGRVRSVGRGQATLKASVGPREAEVDVSVLDMYRFRGYAVPFEIPGLTETQTSKAALLANAGTALFVADGAEHIVFTPTLFDDEPALPPVHLRKAGAGGWLIHGVHQEAVMGVARATVRLEDDGIVAFADQGLEPHWTGYSGWPFGHVWVAQTNRPNIQWKRLSTTPAFYHGVTAADLTGNGLRDIVALHMGTKDWRPDPHSSLHVFQQVSPGVFRQIVGGLEDPSNRETGVWHGAGAVLAVDLDGDGVPEIVQAAYRNNDGANANSGIIIYKQAINNQKNIDYKVTNITTRIGYFEDPKFGATLLRSGDINGDGHMDIVVAYESNEGRDAIEVWLGDGAGGLMPSQWRLQSELATLRVREFELADLDGDGRPDLLVNSWPGELWDGYLRTFDLGSVVRLNRPAGFEPMPPLTLSWPTQTGRPWIKWFVQDGRTKALMMAFSSGTLHIGEFEFGEDFPAWVRGGGR